MILVGLVNAQVPGPLQVAGCGVTSLHRFHRFNRLECTKSNDTQRVSLF